MRDLLLADNQPITRIGIKYIAEQINNISRISEAVCKNDIISSLEKSPQSIIVLDYSIFDFSGINEISILKSRFPASDWIFFPKN